jgi:DNA-directed RNA polymerase subunit RPC12/RpoP
MAIEFHCEHCTQPVKAPDDAAGRPGKCPHCGNTVYIPLPAGADEGEIPLAPLDADDERRRQEAVREAAAVQFQLLHERAMPGEPGARKSPRTEPPPSVTVPLTKELNRLVVKYVEAMAGGRLEEAQKLVSSLTPSRLHAFSILDGMATENLSAYGLPALPRPVLLGFLKQLRSKLQEAPA